MLRMILPAAENTKHAVRIKTGVATKIYETEQPPMKRPDFYSRLCVVVAAALFFVVACAERETSAPPAADERAALIFKRNCAICHGATGEGQRLGASLVPSLREGRAATDSDNHIKAQIARGGNGMPPFASQLSPREIDDLVRYIRTELQAKTKSGE